jgi:tetratricopeptide (TPR) repeat protein
MLVALISFPPGNDYTAAMRRIVPALLIFLSVHCVSAQPPEVAAKFNRAIELQRAGQLAEAAEEYRALLKLKPDYAEVHANLGAVLARLGQYEESVKSYETALKFAPQFTPIWMNLGIAHYRAGQFARAVPALEKFLAAQPSNAQAHQLLGICLVEIGKEAEALPHLEPAVQAGSNDVMVLFSLGSAYVRLQNTRLETVLQKLNAQPQGIALAHLLRGQAHLETFSFEAAVTELEAAAKLNAELPRLQYSLGLSYLKLGRYDAAITCFDRELQKYPNDFGLLYFKAFVQEANGDLGGARTNTEAALKVENESIEARALLAKILLKLGDAPAALPHAEFVVQKEPNDADKHYLLAKIYQRLQRQDDAAREFVAAETIKAKTRAAEKKK